MKIALGADHGGFELKESIKQALQRRGIDVTDFGPASSAPADYPDHARLVADAVAGGAAEQGILVCTTGIGMSMAANKVAGIRAALCTSPEMAVAARTHNNANILTLGARQTTKDAAGPILDAWLANAFSGEERHARRVAKITTIQAREAEVDSIAVTDPEIAQAIRMEFEREDTTVNLIASENYASRAVRQAQGSVMTNKYAEGYPTKRYYNGCEFVDNAEALAIKRAQALFGAEHANVQPHSGSTANMAVYFAAINPGDTILAMNLAHGGHLTHGHAVNFSGRLYRIVSYGVRQDTGRLDYDEIERLAKEHRPKLIVAGASAYSRTLDFPRFRAIADAVGAQLMVDMAHIAGLVAGGVHPSPVPFAEYVTTTTHKTLRGPRSGLVLCRAALGAGLDKQVFPGIQGGPMMHTIAAKAVCFHEAASPAFRTYAAQIVANAKTMAATFVERGFTIVSGGTDNHLMLLDLSPRGMTGKDAAAALDRAGIVVNKNSVPFDTKSPFVTSGIRIGTPSCTTRGMKEPDVRFVAEKIAQVLSTLGDTAVEARVRSEIREFCTKFPTP